MSKSLTNKKKSKTKKALDPKALGRDLTPFEEYRLSLEQGIPSNQAALGEVLQKNIMDPSKEETKTNWKEAGFSGKMGVATNIVGGIGEIANATAANAKIKDTTGDVNNINQFGNTVYNATDYSDAAAQFNNRGELKEYSKNDLTGSAGEKAKNVGKATLSGAKAGAAFGPLGMIIGGAIGAVSSGIGAAVSNNKAKKEAERLNHMSMMADLRNTSNFDINTDNIAYQNNMMDMANYAAYGGLFNKFNGGGPTNSQMATIEDDINTEPNGIIPEKIDLNIPMFIGMQDPKTGEYHNVNMDAYVDPETGAYYNVNTAPYKELRDKKGRLLDRFGTHISGRGLDDDRYKNKATKLHHPELNGFEYLNNWYSNPTRQSILGLNEASSKINFFKRRLENFTRLKDNMLEDDDYYITVKDPKTGEEVKKLNKLGRKKLKEYNKEIDGDKDALLEEYSILEGNVDKKRAKKVRKYLEGRMEYLNSLPIGLGKSGNRTQKFQGLSVNFPEKYEPLFGEKEFINKVAQKMFNPTINEKTGKEDWSKVATGFFVPPQSTSRPFIAIRNVNSDDAHLTAAHEGEHALQLHNNFFTIYKILDEAKKNKPDFDWDDEYWDTPNEINSRLIELKKAIKVNPNKTSWTLDEVKSLQNKNSNNPMISNEILNRYPAEMIVKLLNRTAAYGGPLFKEFSNGVTTINEGGTHEENIHGGVPVGVDDKGVPNLVEEDEVIWNNYVFSNRLEPMKSVRTKYKLGGPKDLTFADAAKDISKMSEEMPNDPIVRRTRDLRLNQLMQEQEVIRMKKEAKKSKQYATGGVLGNLYNGEGEKPNVLNKYSNYTKVGDEFYTPEYMRLYNWFKENSNSKEAQELLSRINAGKFGNVGGNTFTVDDIIRLGKDYKKGPIHDAISKIALEEEPWNDPSIIRPGISPEEWKIDPDPTNTGTVRTNRAKAVIQDVPEEFERSEDEDKPKLGLDKILNAANVGFDVVSGYLDRFLTKPDYSHYDSFRDAINRANVRVAADPVVSNLRYKPFDTQSIYNRMQANNAANARNIMNTSGGNSAIARASLLTNDNNFNNSLGNLWRQVEEGEYARRMNYDKYMTDIAAGNSARKMQADSTNANIASNQAGLWKQYADARQNIDNLTSAALSTNYNTAKQSLQGYAQQLWAENNIDNAIKNGYLIDNATGKRYNVTAETPTTPKPVEEGTGAYGGKIKRTNKKKRRLS